MNERRAYPGGRDDSDLTVQPVRKTQQKPPSVEEHDEPETPQSSDSEAGE